MMQHYLQWKLILLTLESTLEDRRTKFFTELEYITVDAPATRLTFKILLFIDPVANYSTAIS